MHEPLNYTLNIIKKESAMKFYSVTYIQKGSEKTAIVPGSQLKQNDSGETRYRPFPSGRLFFGDGVVVDFETITVKPIR